MAKVNYYIYDIIGLYHETKVCFERL